MVEVFNINDLIYKVNAGSTQSQTKADSKTMEYKEVLDKIRHIISKQHSSELIGVLYSPEAGEKLKSLIVRYLNQNRFSVSNCPNISNLADKIYKDMAGFGVLTKYLYDEAVEEININAWNCIEVLYPDKLIFLKETFISPDDCMDKIKKMVWLGGSIIDGSNPKVDSFIGEGIRISAIIPPCVDKKTGGVASIRRQKENVITRDLMIEYGSATVDELDFLSLCVNNGVSLAIAGSTGSGKTTDLAYLISCLDICKRIYTIEDTREFSTISEVWEYDICLMPLNRDGALQASIMAIQNFRKIIGGYYGATENIPSALYACDAVSEESTFIVAMDMNITRIEQALKQSKSANKIPNLICFRFQRDMLRELITLKSPQEARFRIINKNKIGDLFQSLRLDFEKVAPCMTKEGEYVSINDSG